MADVDVREAFLQMDQAITTQAQVITTQAQAMTTQAYREVVPRGHQQVSTMASHLRDFTKINPPTLYRSKLEIYPQEFIHET